MHSLATLNIDFILAQSVEIGVGGMCSFDIISKVQRWIIAHA